MNYNHIAGQKASRIEALSDGVFAISMTLLVLDLKVPATELIHSNQDVFRFFLQYKFKFISYFLGFMTLGLFWVGHTTQLHLIKQSDKTYSWYSILFLSLISLLPFTTAFLSEYPMLKSSFLIYWINLLFSGIALLLSFNHAHNKKLISEEYLPDFITIKKAYFDRILYAQLFYFIGCLLCFIDYRMSLGFIILVQLNFAVGFSKNNKNE